MYELICSDGKTVALKTMGDVLWELNARHDLAHSPYASGTVVPAEVWNNRAHFLMVVRRGRHWGVGVSPEADAESVLRAWIEEVAGYARTPDGKILRPHQMSRSEWGAINAIGQAAYGVLPCFSERQLRGSDQREAFTCLSDVMLTRYRELFGFGHNGPEYNASGHTNSRHEVHVAFALGRGEPVPDRVLSDYREIDVDRWTDLVGMRPLLDKPFLRGVLGCFDTVSSVVSLTRGSVELTEEVVSKLAPPVRALAPWATYLQVDDVLYDLGLIKTRPVPALPSRASLGTPVNAFAKTLRDRLVEWKMQKELAALEKNRIGLSHREWNWQIARIGTISASEGYTWANRVAKAIAEKDLAFLIHVLDGRDNVASQKAVEAEFGVKLRNVSARERRRSVLRVAGYVTEAEIAAAEAVLSHEAAGRAEQRAAAGAAQRLEGARERAKVSRFNFEGAVVTGEKLIETLVARGFTDVTSTRKGAVPCYWLARPAKDGRQYQLSKARGTLDYAVELLQRRDDGQPSPAVLVAERPA